MTGEVNKREFRSFDPREASSALSSLHSYWGSLEDVKDLMEHFCYCVENNKQIPKPILQYLQDSFSRYLFDQQTLETAFKITSSKGRKELPPPELWPNAPDCVVSTVSYILDGYLKDKAKMAVINDWATKGKNLRKSTLDDHFKKYAGNALSLIAFEREHLNQAFTESEKQQIHKYFNSDFTPK